MRVALLAKRSQYEMAILHENSLVQDKIHAQVPETATMLLAHNEHTRDLGRLRAILEAREPFITVDYFCRENLSEPELLVEYQMADLVIAFGGDGTYLWGARHLRFGQPIISINSSPLTSVGFYSCGSVTEFEHYCKQGLLSGNLSSFAFESLGVIRYYVYRDTELFKEGVAVNDILVSAAHPAAVSKYWIGHDGKGTAHISSGIWLCTPLGSHAAMRSAGGYVQPDLDNRMQWRVRERFTHPGVATQFRSTDLVEGFANSYAPIWISSYMREGLVSPDGDSLSFPFSYGNRLSCVYEPDSLRLLLRRKT